MILYLDTSALVKRYFDEPFTAEIADLWQQAADIVTSSVAYAETMSAIHRKMREGLDPGTAKSLISLFRADWNNLIRVAVTDQLNAFIDNNLQHQPLRGFDAIHLASAMMIRMHLFEGFLFACFDIRLAEAARSAGIAVYSGTTP
jgi:predicted nucleic acid-binding protein